jgi:hypothetical protein
LALLLRRTSRALLLALMIASSSACASQLSPSDQEAFSELADSLEYGPDLRHA